MIVKGHDFPKVTLVGVLAADLSLNMSDYRAGERTFQLLAQAVGRAGRGSLPGEAVIQTYQPEHYAVVHAANQNYEGFYGEEIIYREMVGYPPVSNMLAVQVFSREEESGFALADRLAAEVKEKFIKPEVKGAGGTIPLQLMGPAPATIGRINDIFRFVFYVKSLKYGKLVKIKDMVEEGLRRQPPDGELTVQFDFNPIHIM